MALTTTQILQINKHLKISPNPTNQDLTMYLSVLQDGGSMEAELTQAIVVCNNRLSDLDEARENVDDIVSGGGAKFNHDNVINAKTRLYNDSVENLARIINRPSPTMSGKAVGFFAL